MAMLSALFRAALMLGLGVLVVAVVLTLLVLAVVGLGLRRLLRWVRGEQAPADAWFELRQSTASAVWRQYQSRYQRPSGAARGATVEAQDVDFREAPASPHASTTPALPRWERD
jgi:Na+-transporting methylmalonyl-CoA/oxaloacetate decarboxylase gamma subunit